MYAESHKNALFDRCHWYSCCFMHNNLKWANRVILLTHTTEIDTTIKNVRISKRTTSTTAAAAAAEAANKRRGKKKKDRKKETAVTVNRPVAVMPI